MRTLILLLSFLPFLSHAGQPAVVSVKVNNVSDSNIEFQADQPCPQVNPEKKSFRLNAGFEWKMDLERGTLVSATAGNETLRFFLEPGDAITVTFDPSGKPLYPEFSGKGAENNRMFNDFSKKFATDFNPSNIKATMEAASSVDVFESVLFEQRLKQMKFMKEHFDKNTITPGFRDFLNNQISYHYFEQLLNYSMLMSDDPTGLKASKIPDIMLSEMKSVPLADERDMNSPSYRGFLSNYIRYSVSEMNSFVKFLDYSDLLEREYNYALRYLTGEPFNYWLSNELFVYCDKASPETVKKLHRALTQSDVKGDYVKPVSAKCQQEINAKEVKKEKPADEPVAKEKETKTSKKPSNQPFTLIDLKGNKVYLDNFKGKVLYVDFWASWCGPCRQQFPHAKELHKMLSPDHLKQVVFLYISIDNDETTWKNAIEKNGIEGFNTLSPGGWSSSAAQHFGVHSIPRYMLIDKNGNIADSNAKRPSSGQEIINDIVTLLRK